MEHIAIMKKSWGLTQKILSGQKTIESRWYRMKHTPWDRVQSREKVYFKDSGMPVTLQAEVDHVLQYATLTPEKVKEILHYYGEADGLDKEKIPEFFELFKDKSYCILIFLKQPKKIDPFNINKKGYGMQATWITIDNVDRIKTNTQ